jgi:hypothetical protein
MPYYRDSDEESILSDDRGESPRRSVDETNNPDFIRELFERHERRKNRYDSNEKHERKTQVRTVSIAWTEEQCVAENTYLF